MAGTSCPAAPNWYLRPHQLPPLLELIVSALFLLATLPIDLPTLELISWATECGSIAGPMSGSAARHRNSEVSVSATIAVVAQKQDAGLRLLFMALATPDRMKSGIDGAGGAVEDVRTVEVDESAHTARRSSTSCCRTRPGGEVH